MFKEKIEDTAKNKQSRLILALDFPFQIQDNRKKLLVKAQEVLDAVHKYLCAVKINHHLVLPLGTFDGVQQIVKRVHEKGLLAIMDCKANDIGATNQIIAEYYYAAGFDALIANPFVGWEEGLKPVFDTARKLQRGVILLTYMSHKGANEGYGQTTYDLKANSKISQYIAFAKKALKWNADGAVVGATYPEKIREIYAVLGEKVPIFSPGIGTQGGTMEASLKAGTCYPIVGRAITLVQNPSAAAEKLCNTIRHSR